MARFERHLAAERQTASALMKPSPLTEASASIYIYTSRLKFTWDEMAGTTRHSELSRAWRASFNIASATEASTWSSPSLRHSFGTTEASASTTLDLSIKGISLGGVPIPLGGSATPLGAHLNPGLFVELAVHTV